MIRVILLLVLMSPIWSFGQSESKPEKPSLVELARRERARRAQIKDVKVITNANLKMIKGKIGTSALSQPSAEKSGGENAQPQEKSKKSPAQWKADFGEARLAVVNAVNKFQVLQLRMNDLRNSYFQTSDGTTQRRIQTELEQTSKEIEATRKEIAAARQKIQQLQAQAGKAGLTAAQIQEMVGKLPQEGSIKPKSGPGS